MQGVNFSSFVPPASLTSSLNAMGPGNRNYLMMTGFTVHGRLSGRRAPKSPGKGHIDLKKSSFIFKLRDGRQAR
jgi:hypothetical protein